MPEARLWRDELGFVASEMEAIIEEMLAIEDCDVVVGAERKAEIVVDSEFRLLGFEDVVVAARKSVSTKGVGIDRKEAYMT